MKINKKICLGLAALMIASVLLAGCGDDAADKRNAAQQKKEDTSVYDMSSTKDGTYEVISSANKDHGTTKLIVTIKDHKFTDVQVIGIDKDGKIKDNNYGTEDGEVTNEGTYKKAQLAIKAAAAYTDQLKEVQRIDKVDAIAGATISYNQFKEAGKKVVEQAKQ